jgi:hypothetical protein
LRPGLVLCLLLACAPAGAPMQAVVDPLTLEDMIAAAAYAAALTP